MKILKAILIISIFLPLVSAQAQVDNLVVEFEQTPLFNEANFLPGEGATRWIKVANNSSETQRIAAQAINVSDSNCLGCVINLEIKENGVTRYNDALSKFFNAGEVFLSELTGNGAQTQYDFIATFYSGTKDPFQGKSLSFDIIIGFQGTEGGLLPGAGSGGGGGGGILFPPGLTIQNEATATTTATSVTFVWTTSYPATSQIIYAKEGEKHILDLTDNAGTPPKYGYERTTSESDISPKAISHLVVIDGLTPGATYYYRTVSHASLAIGEERSFTTLKKMAKEELSEGQINSEEISSGGETASIQPEEKENALSSISAKIKTNVRGLEENKSFLGRIGNLAASLFLGFSNDKWQFIAWLVLVSAVLVFILLFKKKRNN